jgi:hypothetical protein
MLFCFATKYTLVDINDLTATIKILDIFARAYGLETNMRKT